MPGLFLYVARGALCCLPDPLYSFLRFFFDSVSVNELDAVDRTCVCITGNNGVGIEIRNMSVKKMIYDIIGK